MQNTFKTKVVPESVLALLDDQPWDQILDRLTVYAHMLIGRLFWRGEQAGMVPGGKEAVDFAKEAILDIYDGTRDWDPKKYPNLATHLRFIVKSKVSNAVMSCENRSDIRLTEEDGTHYDQDDTSFFAFHDYLRDEPGLQSIMECLYNGYTDRADIAAKLGLSADEVTNRWKKLERRFRGFQSLGQDEKEGS